MNVKPKVIIILVVLMITAIAVQLYRGDVILKIFSVDQAIDNDLKTTDLNFFTLICDAAIHKYKKKS